jgi:GMP synthase PP-ATPase subunit
MTLSRHGRDFVSSVRCCERAIAQVRAQVGKEKVIWGLSRGMDSGVVAVPLHESSGDQLQCVFEAEATAARSP